jgi:hypothetical protein
MVSIKIHHSRSLLGVQSNKDYFLVHLLVICLAFSSTELICFEAPKLEEDWLHPSSWQLTTNRYSHQTDCRLLPARVKNNALLEVGYATFSRSRHSKRRKPLIQIFDPKKQKNLRW